jgi:hypothetical protein
MTGKCCKIYTEYLHEYSTVTQTSLHSEQQTSQLDVHCGYRSGTSGLINFFDNDNAFCKMRLGLVSDTHGVYDQVGEAHCSLCSADSELRDDDVFRL